MNGFEEGEDEERILIFEDHSRDAANEINHKRVCFVLLNSFEEKFKYFGDISFHVLTFIIFVNIYFKLYQLIDKIRKKETK